MIYTLEKPTEEQQLALIEVEKILEQVGLMLIGTRPKDR